MLLVILFRLSPNFSRKTLLFFYVCSKLQLKEKGEAPPVWRETPPPSLPVKIKVRLLRMTVKNTTFIVFFKLSLGHVKSKDFVNFWLFFGGFFYLPPARPFIAMPMFMQMKGVEVMHMSCNFRITSDL